MKLAQALEDIRWFFYVWGHIEVAIYSINDEDESWEGYIAWAAITNYPMTAGEILESWRKHREA